MATRAKTVGRYKKLERIGHGNFGVVYRGMDVKTRKVVAIKTLDLDTVDDDVESVQHEVALLAHLSQAESSNVTKYFGTVLDGSSLWIIMDLCAGGSLRTLLQAGPLDERQTSVVFREITIAVAAVHAEGIIHRDIKAANVLITLGGQVKLCDFGVAAQASGKSKRMTVVGTPYWMAPEVITEGSSYDRKADIWSLGITFYEIITGKPPYAEHEAMRALMLITNSRPPRLEGPAYPPLAKDLIAQCLDEDPAARPNAVRLLKHKFITNYQKTSTSALKVLVERYVAWKKKNETRDSLLTFNPHENADDDGGLGTEKHSWEFDLTSDRVPRSTRHFARELAARESLSDAPDAIRELFGLEPTGDDDLLAARPPPAEKPVCSDSSTQASTQGSTLSSAPTSASVVPQKQLHIAIPDERDSELVPRTPSTQIHGAFDEEAPQIPPFSPQQFVFPGPLSRSASTARPNRTATPAPHLAQAAGAMGLGLAAKTASQTSQTSQTSQSSQTGQPNALSGTQPSLPTSANVGHAGSGQFVYQSQPIQANQTLPFGAPLASVGAGALPGAASSTTSVSGASATTMTPGAGSGVPLPRSASSHAIAQTPTTAPTDYFGSPRIPLSTLAVADENQDLLSPRSTSPQAQATLAQLPQLFHPEPSHHSSVGSSNGSGSVRSRTGSTSGSVTGAVSGSLSTAPSPLQSAPTSPKRVLKTAPPRLQMRQTFRQQWQDAPWVAGFPPMVRVDTSLLLDTTPQDLAAEHVIELLGALKHAFASIATLCE